MPFLALHYHPIARSSVSIIVLQKEKVSVKDASKYTTRSPILSVPICPSIYLFNSSLQVPSTIMNDADLCCHKTRSISPSLAGGISLHPTSHVPQSQSQVDTHGRF